MVAEKLLLEGCFKSEANKNRSVNEILYAVDDSGRYVLIDGCAAFRVNDMFNSEIVCKMLRISFPFTGIAKMFEHDDFEAVHKICELEKDGKTLVQFANETGNECYMNKKYYTILQKIDKESPFGCNLYYSPIGKIFSIYSGEIQMGIILPVIR